jgi:MYXO-CTERM domain-containing protein
MTNFLRKGILASLAATGLLAAALPAQAVLLPGSNEMSTVQYGDFAVYSLDLLEQCAGANDVRCKPSGPLPIAANGGFTKTQLTVLTGENGGPQTTNQPEPLPKNAPGDNAFASPSGQQSSTFVMGSLLSPEPTPSFTGDQPGKWDIKVSALRGYLGDNDLVFIFDNAQEGDAANQWLQIWGQARVLSADGTNLLGCFELNSTSAAGCTTPSPAQPSGPFDFSSPYVTVFTGYCVDKVSGVAYNLGTGSAMSCANSNGYYVNGNIGSANADNAAFSQALNDFIFASTTDADWVLSLDIRTANNNGSAETLWICSNCKVSTTTEVSEPASLALLGATLLGAALATRRRLRQG